MSGHARPWWFLAVAGLAAIACDPGGGGAPPEPASDEARLATALQRRVEEPSPELPAVDPGAADLQRGSIIWDYACEGCHGSTGTGQGRVSKLLALEPGDLTDPERAEIFSDEERIEFITEGIEGTPMIGWKDVLSEEEIRAVYAYLRSLAEDRPDGGTE
jgi:mono/diheme cytochrome c family protein